ncbi:MAG: response regulator transcription factor [Ramlibacter sp.]|nr:response regulator transcription factor [Ramlibacter sp.]
MNLKLLIVDDETLARSRLKALLSECTGVALPPLEAATAAEALRLLQHELVDAVLLDIQMPTTDGLDLAAALRTVVPRPAVVFVTAHAEHAIQAFEREALDYLTKPVRMERLQQALDKAARYVQARASQMPDLTEGALVIQDRGRTERVPLGEVLYLKAELKYVTVRTALRSYILDAALAELETRYPEHFLRVHRNALVARRAIRSLEKHMDAVEGDSWAVRLQGIDELLVVSRRQLAQVRETLGN